MMDQLRIYKKVKYYQTHKEELIKIAENGRQFARKDFPRKGSLMIFGLPNRLVQQKYDKC